MSYFTSWPIVCGIWFGMTILLFWFGIRRTRCRELAEVKRFETLPRTTDEAFLQELEIDFGSAFVKPALAVRDAIAELAEVSPESLNASLHTDSDLNRLPYFDSPDTLGVIFEIEKRLGIKIQGDLEDELCQAISRGTIRDIVKAVIEKLEEKGNRLPH